MSVRFTSAQGRWVLVACILGSGLAGIDATVVNIALPAIGRDLHVGFAPLQWTVTAYTLTLAALILLGGSFGDQYGRRRLFVVGVAWFTAASVLCAAAPNATWLIAARALQGIGGALLTPASLAIIEATFAPDDRARAVGAWAGFGGVASAVAPFLGGWLVQATSWRWVFLVNVPFAALSVLLALRHVPETRDPEATRSIDVAGALLGVAGLGGVTYAIIAAPDSGWSSAGVLVSAVVGVAALVAFVLVERWVRHPMLPMVVFRSVQFSAANVVTFVIYGAFGGFLFLLVVALQTVCGFSPLVAGSALLPITVITLLLSARSGRLAQRIGPRAPMTAGPLVCAVGLAMTLRLSTTSDYWTDVLPAVAVFGLGLAILVAPLTASVLAAVPAERAGIASGVNNAVARAANLIAVAALPAVTGLSGAVTSEPLRFLASYRQAVYICLVALVIGAAIALAAVRKLAEAPTAAGTPPVGPVHCPVSVHK